jgi:beta-lactam-binding protein with PASTA domain
MINSKTKPAPKAQPKRAGSNKSGGGSKIGSIIGFLKSHPIIGNIVLIGIVCLALLTVLFFGLKSGTRHGQTIVVPDFVGITIDEARGIAQSKDLKLVVRDSIFDVDLPGGTIVDQLPGTSDVRDVTVKPGRKIYVTINAYSRRQVAVPYVAKQTLRQALNQLERSGLTVDKLVYEPDMTSTDYVERQTIGGREIGPSSKRQVDVGTGVTLYVTYRRDEQNTSAPRLVGLSLAKAKASLWDHGLNVGKIVYDDSANDIVERRSARVYKQSVALGQSARRGATVDLYLSNDDALVDSLKIVADVEAKRVEAERRKQREKEQREADSLAALAL